MLGARPYSQLRNRLEAAPGAFPVPYLVESGLRSTRPWPERGLWAVHPGWVLTHSHVFACRRAVGVHTTPPSSLRDVAGYQSFLLGSREESGAIQPLSVPEARCRLPGCDTPAVESYSLTAGCLATHSRDF